MGVGVCVKLAVSSRPREVEQRRNRSHRPGQGGGVSRSQDTRHLAGRGETHDYRVVRQRPRPPPLRLEGLSKVLPAEREHRPWKRGREALFSTSYGRLRKKMCLFIMY